jgi:hypothetical protein
MDSLLHHIYAKIVITKYVVKNTMIFKKKYKNKEIKKSCLNLNLIQIKIF